MDNQQKREGEHDGLNTTEPNETRAPESTESTDTTSTETSGTSPQQTNKAGTSESGVGNTKTTNSKLVYAVVVAIIAAILIGAYVYMKKTGSAEPADNLGAAGQTTSSADLIELLNLEETNPVAEVNGETLSWKDYERSLNEVLQSAVNSGVDMKNTDTQSQIKQQALTTLVNTELLLQAARGAGITTAEDDVQSEYENIQSQLGGEAELDRMLNQFELSRDELRTSIAEQIAINDYIAREIDPTAIEVTEEEVQTLYDQVSGSAQGGELPPLEEVRGAIESQIQSSKQQQLIAALIDTLREEAEIETML